MISDADTQAVIAALLDVLPDARSRSLALYGSWSDMTPVPCGDCGTPLVEVEQRNSDPVSGYFVGSTQWLEIIDGTGFGRFVDAVFRVHDADRCRGRRELRDPHG